MMETGRRKRRLPCRYQWCWLVAIACALWLPGPAFAQPTRRPIEVRDLRELERAFIELADRVRPSTVALRTFTLAHYRVDGANGRDVRWHPIPLSHGSGAIVRRDGYILTSTHVVDGADQILAVLSNGREFEAEVVQADRRRDLAVVKIDASGMTPVRLGDLSRVHVGQWCFAVGNPFGLANADGQTAFTYGNVSDLGRDLNTELNAGTNLLEERRYYGNLIQTSAAINPGNSGGPLFNLAGEMIGVVTAIATSSGVTEGAGFAIPIDRTTRGIIDRLVDGEEIKYGYLGVVVEPLPRSAGWAAGVEQGRGALVSRLSPADGPAARAHLQRGDIIVEFEGVPIESTDHLVRVVGATPVGTKAEVVYLRDGRRVTTTVSLAAREVAPVAVGDPRQRPQTCYWRGALLAEATAALLSEFGLRHDEFGLVVVDVEPDTDADRAGLRSEHVILKFDDKPVHSIEEFLAADRRAGDRVRLEVSASGGRTSTVDMPKHSRSE